MIKPYLSEGYWESMLRGHGYVSNLESDFSHPTGAFNSWVYPRVIKYKKRPGRFMLNLYHGEIGFRFEWLLKMEDETWINLVNTDPLIIMSPGGEFFNELILVIEAVVDPGKAPLLIGIDWATGITELLLKAESDE